DLYGSLDPARERGRVADVLVRGAQAPQERDVPGAVERVERALAVRAAEPDELGLREMEPVHADQARAIAELVGDRVGERRLAAAGRPGDPQDRPAAARREAPRPLDRLVGGDHAVAAARCSSTNCRAEVASSMPSSHVSRQMHSARVSAGDTTADEKLSKVIAPSYPIRSSAAN